MSAAQKKVIWEKRDSVAWVTLNDYEETRNALGNAVSRDMMEILEVVAKDDEIGVLCITGQKDSFCAGMNLREMVARESGGPEAQGSEMRDRVRAFPKVTMAVVNGFCVGGGISLVADCDLAIASDRALFGLPEIRRGAPPGRAMGEIIDTIPDKYAADMILSGRNWDAHKALMAGFVSRVAPHEQLNEVAFAWAKEIASFNKAGLRYAKEGIRRIKDQSTWQQRVRTNTSVNQEMRAEGWRGMVEGGAQAFLAGKTGTKADR